MKVFLTGATGFIGSHVARQLVRDGHEVHALVRQRRPELPVTFVDGDLLAPDFRPPATNFDVCIHLAWFVAPGKYLHAPENRDWVAASLRLAQSIHCHRFVAAGTCFEYALTGEPLTETSRTDPRTTYAQAKLDLFHALPADAAWVRFFYQYGPGEDARRLVPVVIQALLRGEEAKLVPGDRVRDFLHVEDVAAAVCAVATSDLTGAVNIGSGERTRVRDVAGQIGELLGRPELLKFGAIPYRPDEPLDVVADNAKLRTTGWRPRFSLETGLRETIEWWRQVRSQTPER